MASEGASSPTRIIGPLVESAGSAFVVIAFVVPVAAAVVAVGVRNVAILNLVHVVSGAIWAGATIFVAGVYGPVLMGVEPEVRGQVNTPIIPKNVFLFSGVAFAALLTGPVMAVRLGVLEFTSPAVAAALLIGAALLVGAVYLIWLQIAVFQETGTPGPPDGERVAALGGRIGMVSPIMLVLQLAMLIDMTMLPTG